MFSDFPRQQSLGFVSETILNTYVNLILKRPMISNNLYGLYRVYMAHGMLFCDF